MDTPKVGEYYFFQDWLTFENSAVIQIVSEEEFAKYGDRELVKDPHWWIYGKVVWSPPGFYETEVDYDCWSDNYKDYMKKVSQEDAAMYILQHKDDDC